MTDKTTTADARRIWEAAAPGWAKWEAKLSSEFSDATELLIDVANVHPGMKVLDVACGAGSQGLRLAERVGPEGHVLACDISATMLEHVRRNAVDAGVGNIETLECAAEDLDPSLGPFDASICRLGLMLFPSPRLALDAILQVLKPGARFAALVFTTPAKTPFLSQSMGILLRHAERTPPGPGQPGLFALGKEGVLPDLMRDCGFIDLETRQLQARLRLPDAAAALVMLQEAVGALRAIVADLDPDAQAPAWQEVAANLRQFESGGRFEADLEFAIVAGAKAR